MTSYSAMRTNKGYYFLNGKRVSRERYEHIETMARMFGRIECLYSKYQAGYQGTIRRYATFTF